MKVDRYVEPAEFENWKQVAEDMGFLYVASGPLVRSSYKVGADVDDLRFVGLTIIDFTLKGWRILHREHSSWQSKPGSRC